MGSIPAEVIERFAAKKATDLAAARVLFDQLEDFLRRAAVSTVSPTSKVDEAWHEFILDTRRYWGYCLDNFGKFIHHVPATRLETQSDSCSTGQDDVTVDHCSSDCASGCSSGGFVEEENGR